MLYFRIQEPMVAAAAPLTEEKAAAAVQDSMRLDGLVLNDEAVVRDMDHDFADGSAFLPVKVNKDGTIRQSASVATMQQFGVLSKYVKQTLRQIGDNILRGRIDIAPYQNGELSPCMYCAYKSVCKFDPARTGNRYRVCEKVKVSELWDKLNQE